MNDTSLPELDADAKAMLRAFRSERRLPEDVHDRVWERVEHSAAQDRRGRFVRGGVVLGVLAAAAAAVLWLGGGLSSSTTSSETPHQAGYGRADGGSAQGTAVEREPRAVHEASSRDRATSPSAGDGARADDATSPEPIPSEPPVGSSETAAPGSSVAVSPSPSSKAPRASKRRPDEQPATSPSSPSEPAVGGTLAEENRLLGRARAALLDERPEHALSWLREHATSFPQGVLAQERDALWAVALCEADRPQQGRPAARAFLQAHPDSALASRVRDACLAD